MLKFNKQINCLNMRDNSVFNEVIVNPHPYDLSSVASYCKHLLIFSTKIKTLFLNKL